jgi:hypothetical protein
MDEHGYSITTLHRMLSDLTHLFHGKLRKGGTPKVILGGDLNASIQMDAKQGDDSHRIFFQRLEDLAWSIAREPSRTVGHGRCGIKTVIFHG